MEPPDKRFSEFVDVVKSWIPWRSETSNVSRDFWMPDQSCRVCYECDTQFTVFNRRHHCRLCGRVFCAKCTSNSIPISSDYPKHVREEGERLRVCNYCFKRWEQDSVVADNGIQACIPVLSPSPSTTSLASTKSSGTGISSTTTAGSVSYPSGVYLCAPYSSAPSPCQSIQMEPCPDNKDMLLVSKTDLVMDLGNPSSNQFGFCLNRSDDEDDEYGACHFDSETQQFQTSDEYYGPVELDGVDQAYRSNKVYPAEENSDAKEICSPIRVNTELDSSLGVDMAAEEAAHDNSYESDASSAIYRMEGSGMEPVDFENNRLLWLPPEPEDEEDEKEPALFADDDEDASGEWGYLRSSNSFGSGEHRCRDRSIEEHKKVMQNVVDGHFRALISQLLQVENLPMSEEDNKDSWLDVITSLSWEAATFLKPDTSKGGGMDPGGYVKVKCIACGRRSESMVVKGIVCKKNVAHRRMLLKIEKPRLLILGGALEYQRVTNTLSSVDTLLQQEMDHLRMAVSKIHAHNPNILLVEKSVSRFAQECLLAKNISLVLNIKRPLLERIARCTGAQIIPSIDHVSSPKLGHCDLFHVEKIFEEHGSAGQGGKKMMKTLMFFEGCRKPLGCTVLLKGANGDELKKVKHVLQYGVFAAYHLALETSFLADEGASLPELPLKSPIAVALPDKPSSIDRSISTIPGFTVPAAGKQQLTSNVQSSSTLDPIIAAHNIGNKEMSVPPHSSGGCSSHFSESAPSFMLPSGKTSGFPLEDGCATHVGEQPGHCASPLCGHFSTCPRKERNKVGFSGHVDVDSLRNSDKTMDTNLDNFERGEGMANDTQSSNKQIIDRQPGSSHSEISHQSNNQMDDHSLQKDEIPPSPTDHQSILVSLSSRCVWKGTVCERAHLFRIKYYGSFDKPLGRFLRDHLFDQSYRCRSCEMPSEAHVHCYTHRQGSLTISVRKLLDILLPGERDGKIWMWHRCLRCPRINGFPPATRRVVMSDAAWGLSFGKFLELSFSNNAAASRVASCGHSLHRDCLRFYGFGTMVACFRYAPINLHSVYLPPPKLDFNYQLQEWVQREADEVAKKAELLFTEILHKLHQIAEKKLNTLAPNGNVKVPESGHHIVQLEGMLQIEKEEFEEFLRKVAKKEGKQGKPVIDILEINKLRRQLLFQSFLWDQRLIFAANSDNNSYQMLSCFLPRNKEKLGLTDKLADLNLSPKPLKGSVSLDALPSNPKRDDPSPGCMHPIACQEGSLDRLDQTFVCQERRDTEQDHFAKKQNTPSLVTNASDQLDPLESGFVVRRVFSDGQFPVRADLSDTLDAKWRGENSPALADVKMPNLCASAGVSPALSVSEDSEERSGDQSFSSTAPTRLSDSVEDFSSWSAMLFLNFYQSVNKNWGIASKLDALSEYNPVYVSLFRELVRQGGARLFLPVGVNDTVIPVYDDEPTSIISYALVSQDYHCQLSDERERIRDNEDSSLLLPTYDLGNFYQCQSADNMLSETLKSMGADDDSLLSMSSSRSSLIVDPLAYTKAMHVRVSFCDDGPLGKVKYCVTCYYAKWFDALRKTCCPSEIDFIRSLSRCKKWGAQGGKSNVFFAKSLDDRFIIKQVTKTELESFIKVAPEYFRYLSESINTGSPTCLAKILGIYQITTKHLKGGRESRMDVLVMENLLFGRSVTRLYDLKGSSRSRYNPDSSGNNKVLLDQNLIEAMPTSPIFVGNKAKRLLERAVWNDTAFLASIDVMDYSLLVGVDEEKHELVLGIIDFMRQYTWDKHLETWVKTSGILGGPKNASPTVISPKQYKKRFRKAMSAYFLVVPDQWPPPTIAPSKSQSDLREDDQQNTLVQT